MTNPDQVLSRLSKLHPKIIDLNLGRIECLLERLGQPHLHLPPVIHVAGTNGKGSVIAYLRAINEAKGKKVHVYTSPHLVQFRERILLAGQLIEDKYLLELLEECERANGSDAITLFEITTAAAFLAFSRMPADLLLLETGLGGRLDATNVLEQPLATIITPISLDHQQYLGDDLFSIAKEKAGIIKRKCPLILGRQESEALKAIQEKAQALEAPMIQYGSDYRLEKGVNDFLFIDHQGQSTYPLPNLPGEHQIFNAAIAITTMRHLEPISDEHIAKGISQAQWPARLQLLKNGPLLDRLTPQSELWLDGGHNEAAGQILAHYFRQLPPRPLHLIFGMLTTKDPEAFLRHFQGQDIHLHCLTIPGEHESFDGSVLVSIAKKLGLNADECLSPDHAITMILAHNPEPQRILICGSLYLAGVILSDHE